MEAFVVRTPNDSTPSDQLIEMPPLGATTGGAGLWNRLDHASPSPADTEDYPKLADTLAVPITAGEELCNRFQFRDMFAKQPIARRD